MSLFGHEVKRHRKTSGFLPTQTEIHQNQQFFFIFQNYTKKDDKNIVFYTKKTWKIKGKSKYR